MQLIIDVLIVFIVLSCVLKLSLWRPWQQLVYSLLLGAFALWSVRYAVEQSKTQISDFLQDTSALQTMAILVTIESAVGLIFGLSWLNGWQERTGVARTVVRHLLWFYPSLLMLPVVFYLLTQAIFMATGIDFETTGWLIAVAVTLLLPLSALGARWLLPDKTGRIEMYLLLTIFVCILGLVSTEHGKMVYQIKESPIDWTALGLTLGGFVLLALAGYVLNRIKWKLNNKK